MAKTYAELDLTQIRRFERTIKRIPEDMRESVLRESGEALLGEAQVESPVLSGFLSESHYVGDFEDGAQIIGVNADYAMAVHENHPTKKHWFVNAIRKNFRRVIGRSIRQHLRDRGAR